MPLKGNYGASGFKGPTINPLSPDVAPPEPEVSPLRRLLGGGIRAVSGALSAGGLTSGGPLIAGAGELGAELAEGSPLSIKRALAEAALGAVPFGAVLKEGRPLASAIRGAVFSGSGEALREAARDEPVDLSQVGQAALGGGVLTGGLAKLFGKATGTTEPPTPRIPDPVGSYVDTRTGERFPLKKALTPRSIGPLDGSRRDFLGTVESHLDAALSTDKISKTSVKDVDKGIQSAGKTGLKLRKQVLDDLVAEERGHATASALVAREQAAAEKLRQRLENEAEIRRRQENLIESEPTVSETIRAGNKSSTTRWKAETTAPAGGEGESSPRPLTPLQQIKTEREAKVADFYREWIKQGRNPIEAERLARKGVDPFKEQVGVPLDASAQPQAKTQVAAPEAVVIPPKVQAAVIQEAKGAPEVTEPQGIPITGVTKKGRPFVSAKGASGAHYRQLKEALARGETIPPEALAVARAALTSPSEVAVKAGAKVGDDLGQSLLGRFLSPEKLKEASIPEVSGPGPAYVPSTVPSIPEAPAGWAEKLLQETPATGEDWATQLSQEIDQYSDPVRAQLHDLGQPFSPKTPEVNPIAPAGEPMPVAKVTTAKTPEDVGVGVEWAGELPQGTQPRETSPLGKLLKAGKSAEAVVAQTPLAKRVAAMKARPIKAINLGSGEPLEGRTPSFIKGELDTTPPDMSKKGTSGLPLDKPRLSKIKTKLGGEAGATSLGALAHLLAVPAGAAIGGIVGGQAGHPILGAIAGGLAGAAGPSLMSHALSTMSDVGVPPNVAQEATGVMKTLSDGASQAAEGIRGQVASIDPQAVSGMVSKVFRTLPQVQRFNYLMDAWGLPANALAGPYGSAVMAALEHGLSGDRRGWDALRSLANVPKFKDYYLDSFGEAKSLLEHGELGGTRSEDSFSPSFKIPGLGTSQPLQAPGLLMTAGDVAARRILMEAGFSEEEAKRIVLTSEPELPAFKSIANFGKTSPLLSMLFPFRRTPANIAEQGMERAPVIGSFLQGKREIPDSLRQQLVQQGMSLGVGGLSYELGKNLDPETGKIARRYVSNFAGQYGLPASVGFAAGQSVEAGKPVMSAATVEGLRDALPLPTTTTLTDWLKYLEGTGPIPRGAMPPALRNVIMPNQ